MDDGHSERSGWSLLRLNAETRNRPSSFRLLGREWDLLEDVFAPIYCPSTQHFATWLPYPVDGSFLEVGCGTGVVAVTAATRGCRHVTALDISAAAVENTLRNVRRHGLSDSVRVLRSDLFDALHPDERFDAVFWNSNFIELPAGTAPDAELQRAIFDAGYETHRRYLESAGRHLTANGRLFLGFSSLGSHDRLTALAAANRLRVRQVRSSLHRTPVAMEYQLLELLPERDHEHVDA